MQKSVFLPKLAIKSITHFLSKEEFFLEYVQSSTPVIILKELEKEKWTFDWLKENIGDVTITVGHRLLGKNVKQRSTRKTTVRDYVNAIFSDHGEKHYLGAVDLTKSVPSLKQRIDRHNYFVNKKLQRVNFFVGPGNTISQLHCDYAENIFSQCVGKKRIQLYSPKKEMLQYKMYESLTSSYNSLDFENINEAEREMLSAPDYDFVIENGQMLYIPYGWWHRVISLEPSISIAQWWMNYRQLTQRAFWAIKSLNPMRPRA